MTAADDFYERLCAVWADAHDCAAFVYTMLPIRMRSAQEPMLAERLRRHEEFWGVTLGAMQNAAIAAMGRIYDDDKNVYSANRLLNFAVDYPGIFGAADVQARKQARGVGAQVTAKPADTQFTPSPKPDFTMLMNALKATTTLYKEKIRPLRHKAVAHRGPISRIDLMQLYENIPLPDFERLAVFPLQMCQALFDMFENGKSPELPTMPMSVAEMLAKPLSPRNIGYPQQEFVREAAAFLDWLIRTPQSM